VTLIHFSERGKQVQMWHVCLSLAHGKASEDPKVTDLQGALCLQYCLPCTGSKASYYQSSQCFMYMCVDRISFSLPLADVRTPSSPNVL
jgi:hypothetical protein